LGISWEKREKPPLNERGTLPWFRVGEWSSPASPAHALKEENWGTAEGADANRAQIFLDFFPLALDDKMIEIRKCRESGVR